MNSHSWSTYNTGSQLIHIIKFLRFTHIYWVRLPVFIPWVIFLPVIGCSAPTSHRNLTSSRNHFIPFELKNLFSQNKIYRGCIFLLSKPVPMSLCMIISVCSCQLRVKGRSPPGNKEFPRFALILTRFLHIQDQKLLLGLCTSAHL